MTSPEPTPDLHALALAATWQHYARRIHLSRKPGYQAICGCGWESAPTAKRDEADAQHSNHLADAVLAAVLPAHRAMVLDEVAGLIRDEADRWDRLGYDDEGAWRAAVRIAATGAPVSAASTPPARQGGPGATGEATAVPETTPDTHSGAQDDEPTACRRCRRRFDPDDKDPAGTARYSESNFCRGCVDRCHESTDAFHECPVCAS